jgi:hypothetical protein
MLIMTQGKAENFFGMKIRELSSGGPAKPHDLKAYDKAEATFRTTHSNDILQQVML